MASTAGGRTGEGNARRRLVLAGGIAALLMAAGAGGAFAQDGDGGARRDDTRQERRGEQGYRETMQRMQERMPNRMTGDPDEDFVRHMIPHHRAAVDMAEIEIRRGNDPDVKQMARRMAEERKNEIDRLEKWLKNRQRKD